MAVPVRAIIKAGVSVLSNEKTRNILGWVLTAVFAPVILLAVLLCSIGSGAAEHNNAAVRACFYGTDFADGLPIEYRVHISEMRTAFNRLDTAISEANTKAEPGNSLDPIRVKAVFFALCFGDEAPSKREAGRFTGCFYASPSGITCPLPLAAAYDNLTAELGRPVTEDEKANAAHVYSMIAAPSVSSAGAGVRYLAGGDAALEIDVSIFADPGTKNADDLAAYAVNAWESGWGYVWGTYGTVLTDSLFSYKLEQYPDAVGGYADFIQTHWLGGRATDCVGLIKGYGWLDVETMTIGYGTNGMPDVGANQMYYAASVSGTIDTIPETLGLAVWCDGHIGVYIGGGEVIEAMGTRYGVVKTRLADRPWTHWLEVPYINYD